MSESYRDTLYTINKSGKRIWVYPAIVKGFFFTKRQIVAYGLMLFYLSMPWLTMNGKQAVLLDLAHRKFTFFGTTFWATDTLPLVFVLGGLAIALFFFTSLFGRVWCGWACPETVFLEFLFRPIERLIEGSPAQRLKLDSKPWDFEKVRKKFLKHFLCAFFSWIIASTFLAYFLGREPLINMMTNWPHHNLVPFLLTLTIMGIFAFQFGWFREQFCTVLCPYARFQSVLMDKNSLVVGYDTKRGEPRGKLKKGTDLNKEKGDCIDCGLCVRVCPTGIDIRNGLQLECISCTACIDACDSIMEKIDKPKGLIRYDTEATLIGENSRILRPRVIIYAVILIGVISLFALTLKERSLTDYQVLREIKDTPFKMINENTISNHLKIVIGNKSDSDNVYNFSVIDEEQITLISPMSPLKLSKGAKQTVPIFINFPTSLLKQGKHKIVIQLTDKNQEKIKQQVTLIGPDE